MIMMHVSVFLSPEKYNTLYKLSWVQSSFLLSKIIMFKRLLEKLSLLEIYLNGGDV